MSTRVPARPRPISGRGWLIVAIVLVLLAIAYTYVITNYNAEGGSRVTGGLGPTSTPGLMVTMQPTTIDATKDVATLQYTFVMTGDQYVDAQQHLKENLRIFIESASGTQEVKYQAGDAVGRIDGTIPIDGEIAQYPLDSYAATTLISADTYTVGTDGSMASSGPVRVGLQGTGGINGWDTLMTLPVSMSDVALASLTFTRAFSTQAFALVMLAMVSVLAAFALVVSLLVLTRRRRVEVALLGWTAALLFALPLLRTYLPNSPPVGAAIDVFIYLWVILAAALACVFIVAAWIGQTRTALAAESDPEAHRAA